MRIGPACPFPAAEIMVAPGGKQPLAVLGSD